jgi:hypothetical protein
MIALMKSKKIARVGNSRLDTPQYFEVKKPFSTKQKSTSCERVDFCF